MPHSHTMPRELKKTQLHWSMVIIGTLSSSQTPLLVNKSLKSVKLLMLGSFRKRWGLDIPFILTLPNLSLWIDFHGSYVRHDVVVSTSNLQLEDKASKNGTENPSFREINTWTFKQIRLYFGYFPSLGQHFQNRASRYTRN